jgi:heme oxygenase
VPDPGGIISRLNASTRHFHAHVDDPWLGLLRPTVGVADYVRVLIRLYGLVAPFESACKYTPGLARLVDFRQLIRAGFIAQDLLSLNMGPAQVSDIPTCPSLTIFRTPQEAVGWLYVVERSMLLQDGVRLHLVKQLPHVEHACTFLTSYEGRGTEQWTAFGRVLERVGAQQAATDEIVAAATSAFATATSWLGNAKNNLRSVG